MYTLRFDMRVPGMNPMQIAEQYEAAVEMGRWVDGKGPFQLAISEHHAAEDGYIPAPLMLASAMAAVTSKVSIMVAATLLPLYDPVRLAEEMIVIDYISRGRVGYVLGIGYRPEEYALFGLDFNRRGAIADEKLAKLLETFRRASSREDRSRVTPAPFSHGHPTLFWGGGSKPAARRAGRNGLGFLAQNNTPGMEDAYREAAHEAGYEPGLCIIPPAEMPGVVFVHPDPDQGWEEVGPYLLADALSYAEWNAAAGMKATNLSRCRTLASLREEQGNYRVVTVEEAVDIFRHWGRLPLHPLCGGIPAELAWPYLRRVVEQVVPAASGTA